MSNLIQLSDVEIAAVSGGTQSINISATQSNSTSVSQSATAYNYGAVTATELSLRAIESHQFGRKLSLVIRNDCLIRSALSAFR